MQTHFLSNKVIEIKLVMKQELTAETIVIQYDYCFKRLANPWTCYKQKRSLTQQVSKTWTNCLKNLEFLVAEISVLKICRTPQQTWKRVTVLDALDFHLIRTFASQLLLKQYMEEDGIELLQNIRTTEIKMTVTKSPCRN